MSEEFDGTPYGRMPILNVASAIALGTRLFANYPRDAPAHVHKSALRARRAVVAMQAEWAAFGKDPDSTDARPADLALDTAWSAFEQFLTGWSRLPVDRHPKAARAAQIHATVFPDGLQFVTLRYEEEWAESDKRVKLLADDAIRADLHKLGADDFVNEVKFTHAAYGDALGMTKAKTVQKGPNFNALLMATRRSMTAYALSVCSWASSDESAVTAARAALSPIDDFRAAAAAHARSGNGTQPPTTVTPTTPIPEVPAVPAK